MKSLRNKIKDLMQDIDGSVDDGIGDSFRDIYADSTSTYVSFLEVTDKIREELGACIVRLPYRDMK